MPQRNKPARRLSLIGAALVGAAAGAWGEGSLRWPSTAAHESVLGAIALVVATAVIAGRGRQLQTSRRFLTAAASSARRGVRRPSLTTALVLAWAGLAAAVLAWDLNSLVAASHQLPTLSRLSGDLSRHRAGRAALSLAWIVLGATIALGRRAPAPSQPPSGHRGAHPAPAPSSNGTFSAIQAAGPPQVRSRRLPGGDGNELAR